MANDTKDLGFAQVMDERYQIADPAGAGLLPHKAITNFANGTLLKSDAPAVLVEGLFMTSTQEEPLLASSDGVRRQQELVIGLGLEPAELALSSLSWPFG